MGISAKRYVLFNIDKNKQIIIRKASAHGLGHLMAPYRENDAPNSIPAPTIPLSKIGVERWQYDLWHQIIRAELDGHPGQIDLDYHPGLNLPAASRYAATTPALLNWFKLHNRNRRYQDQVRPFGFMMAFQVWPDAIRNAGKIPDSKKAIASPKPISPYDTDIARAAANCFDRESGHRVDIKSLKTYREVLAQYHLRPESKFLNGDFRDRGPTERRQVVVNLIRHIGKEANRWEEQFYLGADEEAQIDYGLAPEEIKKTLSGLRAEVRQAGQRRVARESGIARRTLARFMEGKSVRKEIIQRIIRALRNKN